MNKKLFSLPLLLVLVSTIFISSCKKNIDDDPIPVPENPMAIPAASPVTGSISGMVVDETNTPVTGATVHYGTTSVNTDARGMFSFNQVTLDKYVTTVTVTNPGYFKAFRSFSAGASRNFLSIKLLPKTLSGTISSSTAGNVNLTNGTEISFQANSIVVKSTGAAYTGQVKVFASYIDPTSTDISSVVPGSFVGRDASNLYSLQSTGMIAVDLESPAGEPLQLASGSPASIKLPIPVSLLSKAPSTIDTWSLNDQGIWQKEGTATRSGDHYEMQVTHFSFWNCDVPANAVYLTLHVQDQAGNALANMLVSLTVPNSTSWWATTYGITDSLGNVSGLVPANQELIFNSYANVFNCNTSVNTQNIGPFNTNTSLTVTATIATSQTLTISGTATGCNNQPLQSGTAIVYTDMYGYSYVPIVNGNYTATQIHCSPISQVSVTVIDNSTGSQASSGNVAVSGSAVTVPVLSACGGSGNAVFTFGGAAGMCTTPSVSGTYTAGSPIIPGANLVSVEVNVSVPGNYSMSTAMINGISFSGSGVFANTGIQTVFLAASGTPLSGGVNTFQVISAGTNGCTFIIDVMSPPPPQAVFEFGTTGPCNGTTVAGAYIVGVPILGNANTVSFTINVISTGSYNITSSTGNGLQFSDSGYFSTTGPRIVLLRAEGTPTAAVTVNYTTFGSNGTTGCTFSVTATGNSNNSTFTFGGAPGTCTGASLSGTYTSGVAVSAAAGDSISLTVNVVTVGAYAIQTGTNNGFGFSGTGVFASTGVQSVTLYGSGVPNQQGTYTFIPSAAGSTGQGCAFTVAVN